MILRRILAILALCVPGAVAAQQGQQLRGVVRDSSSGTPVPGVVVYAYGDERAIVGRALSDEQGRYRILLSAPVRSARAMRIGFRPREVAIPSVGGDVTLDIALTIIPTLLERVQVVGDASACPRRGDPSQVAGLLDQAKSALLATVVAREAEAATVTRLRYERMLDANGERAVSQTVRAESADRATVSFNSAQSASDFAAKGFLDVHDGRRTFHGPDADVLLDDAFGRAYCFRVADRNVARPDLVGLAFAPSARRGGRVDIDGTLWIDTVARRLSHVDFKYIGLDELSEGFGAGGGVSFREVAPSIVLIDRWNLRLVGGRDSSRNAPPSAQSYAISEIGGELASAEWPNGRRWTAPLGGVTITGVTQSGSPARGTRVALMGTDYETVTDSAGRGTFPFLIPGPYSLTVVDTRLARIGLDIPTELTFTAVRDSMLTRQVVLQTAEEFAAGLCQAGGRLGEESAWLIGRIGASSGAPAPDAKWSVARGDAAGWVPVAEGGPGSGGLFSHCRNLKRGETVQVKAWRGRESPAVAVQVLSDRLNVVPVRLPTAVARRGGTPTTLRGVVRDSAANTVVPGAFVELSGTSFSAFTDSLGEFTINGVSPGEYTAEIRTGLLDSLGAVGRASFDFSRTGTSVRLHVPGTRELHVAMCGPAALPGTVALLGSFTAAEGAKLPASLRAVAEWTEGSEGRLNWMRARADSAGRFRVCGLPRGVEVTLRSQVDSGAGVASRPSRVRLDSASVFAHSTLALEAGLTVGASFGGIVVADSTEEELAGAEIVLPGLNRLAVTGANGSFRFNDIPAGSHRVTIRRPGFAPVTADIGFTENQSVDQRIVLGRAQATLAPVAITAASSVNASFDEHRKLGLGKFLTREELDKQQGRPLGMILGATPSMGVATTSGGTHAWLIGKRTPVRLGPLRVVNTNALTNAGNRRDTVDARMDCSRTTVRTAEDPCNISMDDFREVGYYCPRGGEQATGIRCACYAQVYVDGRLMNKEHPTEPFDINTLNAEDVEGVEWYASPSQTPARYSSLNSPCGVMAIWTRKQRHDE
jgi:hypothetical protein